MPPSLRTEVFLPRSLILPATTVKKAIPMAESEAAIPTSITLSRATKTNSGHMNPSTKKSGPRIPILRERARCLVKNFLNKSCSFRKVKRDL